MIYQIFQMYRILGLCATLLAALSHPAAGAYPLPLKMRESPMPEFDSTPLAVSVQPGETAMLPCRVRNLGDKDVSWMRGTDYMVISHGRSVFTRDPRFHVISPDNDPASWNLQLRNARLSDEGLYECQVNTDPKIQQRILLTVSDKPEVMEMSMKDDSNIYGREDTTILGSRTRYLRHGSTLSLTCQVRIQAGGLPKQRPARLVDWLHNNKSLFEVSGSTVTVDTEKNGNELSSTLTVSSLLAEHSGMYTCRPLIANSTASAMVLVLEGERTEAMQSPSSSEAAGAGGSGLRIVPSSLTPILSLILASLNYVKRLSFTSHA